jgi:ABC-type uncharacterized transport system substrate-binding protein
VSGKPFGARIERLRAILASSLLGAWFGLALAAPVQAHPHAWIDLEIQLEANAGDAVVVLDQTWIIDPIYSRYLYDDAMTQFEGDSPEEKLANLGAEILENLAEYDWYTELYADQTRILVYPEGSPELIMQDGQIRFRFRTRLAEPVDPRTHVLRYAIYDPTYFIELLHHAESPPRLSLSDGPCAMDVRTPRPDPAVVARALALDFNQTGEADLGRHFAERVTVRCD